MFIVQAATTIIFPSEMHAKDLFGSPLQIEPQTQKPKGDQVEFAKFLNTEFLSQCPETYLKMTANDQRDP